ncbi:MAG: TIGR04076 family protein, partial [Candidatus Methanomethylophilaceae archaeon]|nr:TIGR04076 family protein [Candidatus Methanomethylophilaceae archaeon]
ARTVIDKRLYPELQREYCSDPQAGPCPCYNVGDEFVFERDDGKDHFWHGGLGTLVRTDADPAKTAGGPCLPHCSEAWDAISRYIYAGLQGGSIMKGWMKDENVMIACCSDGTRPVVFKIERIDVEDDAPSQKTAEEPSKPVVDAVRPAEPSKPAASAARPAEPPKKDSSSARPAGLPDLFESPAPADFRTDGEFVPELGFGRYWRLNYSFLSPEEQKAYVAMEDAIRRGFSSVKVDLPADNNRLMRIAKSLIEDNWSLFYVDTSITVVQEPGRVDVCFKYNRFKDDRAVLLEKMKGVAREVFETRVKGCRTRYDAEIAIHDYLVENVVYDVSDQELAHSPLGPLLWKKGVCEGISEAFTFLACSCGLKAAMASGTLKKSNHRWNIVELEGERYHVDVTSDLSGLHAYFNCSDALISKTHTPSKKMGCGSDRLNFYKVNGCMFKTAYDAKSYIESKSGAGRGSVFEFMTENGVMPQEVTRMARNGAGGSVGITVTNLDYRFYRIIIK